MDIELQSSAASPLSCPSRQEKRRKLMGGIPQDMLECPVCFEFMYSPIYQCSHGHALCSGCKKKVSDCPTCRVTLTNIRCLMLEKVAAALHLQCRNVDRGCPLMLKYEEKAAHENTCRFRPYHCVVRGCDAVGDVDALVTHVLDKHKFDIYTTSDIQHDFREAHLSDEQGEGRRSCQPLLYLVNGHHLFLHFEEHRGFGSAYAAFVSFLGEPSDAERFKYRLEIRKHERMMAWEGPPRSVREPLDAIAKSHDCLVIPKHLANYFSAGDMSSLELEVIGSIWEKDEI